MSDALPQNQIQELIELRDKLLAPMWFGSAGFLDYDGENFVPVQDVVSRINAIITPQ